MTKEEIDKLVTDNKVVLFIKGEPTAPQCGFSQRAVAILNALQTDFVHKNVLEDDNLRQNVKEYSNWPTIPQLYVDGEFLGGVDIMMEMYKDNSLREALNAKN